MVPIDFTLILPFFAEENNTLFNSVLGGVLKNTWRRVPAF